MQWARRWWAVVVSVPVLGAMLTGCSSSPGPDAVLERYVAAWQHRDWTTMAKLVEKPPRDFAEVNRAALDGLDASEFSVTVSPPTTSGALARAALVEQVNVAGLGQDLTIHTEAVLHKVRGSWLVEWSPSTIDPQLGPGDRFEVRKAWAPRASINGVAGPLLTAVDQVEVGVVGQRLKDPTQVGALLDQAGAPSSAVAQALAQAQAHPTFFVPVFEVSMGDYMTKIRPSPLYSVAGTQFETVTKLQPLTPDLGTYLLGGVGPITAEQLSRLGPPYAAGDQVGQGGLEAQYEKQLAGSPGVTVSIVDSTGATVATLANRPAVPGAPVTTTLSAPVQQAADAAIGSSAVPAALVAVRASTGEILAVANHVPTGPSVDYALDATEAPGSTFKMITSTALIGKGLTPSGSAPCPPTIGVDGENFHNDEGQASGTISFATAFAQSCNTAFIAMTVGHLSAGDLQQAAASYDIGLSPQMGFPAYAGRVPQPADKAALAATAIGQGAVTVAPLNLAMVAAAIDSGTVRPPRLVAGAPDDTAPTHPVDPTVDSDLKAMMAQVVASGTASGAGLPAGTFGKTGTAEFGSANPPQTHCWFVGFRGDIAFAVYVDTGASGGAVAAPLAAKFLTAIG